MDFSKLRSASPRIAVIGDLMIDEYVEGTVCRISQDAPVPILRGHSACRIPGGAGNVARQLAHWNCRVTLFAGIDPAASTVLLEHGVQFHLLGMKLWHSGYRTPVKRRYLVGRQCVFRHDEDGSEMTADLRQDIIAAIVKDTFDAIVISDYNKGLLNSWAIEKIIHGAMCPVIVDHKSRPVAQWAGAAIVKMNAAEAASVDIDTLTDIVEQGVIVTNDGHGYTIASKGASPVTRHTTPIPNPMASGAGDCHVAHLALGIAAGFSLEDAAEFAFLAGRAYVRGAKNRPPLPIEVAKEYDPIGGKIAFADEARRLLAARQPGTIVFSNGVFNVLHPGHIHTLCWARRSGDFLVVGVNDDASATSQRDGPVRSLRERAISLAALQCVDLVVPFSEPTPVRLINDIAPHVLVKGYDTEHIVGDDLVSAMRAPPSGFELHSSDILRGAALSSTT